MKLQFFQRPVAVVPANAGTQTPRRLSSAAAYGSRVSLRSHGTTAKSLARLVSFAFLLLAAIPFARAEDMKVSIDNFTFNPPQLTVKAGTKVTFANHDDIPHTVVSVQNFKSKVLDTEQEFAFTFTTPGTYKYFCSLHPHMTGTIVVEASSSANQ